MGAHLAGWLTMCSVRVVVINDDCHEQPHSNNNNGGGRPNEFEIKSCSIRGGGFIHHHRLAGYDLSQCRIILIIYPPIVIDNNNINCTVVRSLLLR